MKNFKRKKKLKHKKLFDKKELDFFTITKFLY